MIMNKIKLIDTSKLVCHEKIDKARLDQLIGRLKKDGMLKKPVVVDRESLVILDGHHRYQAFCKLGIKKIPCFVVDYFDPKIKVNFRRKDVGNKLIKEIILLYIRLGKIFPYKTTRHIVNNRPIINSKLDL